MPNEINSSGIKEAKEGIEFARESKYDLAIERFTEAIKLNPNEYRYFSNRSWCFEKIAKHDLALIDAERAIEICETGSAYHRLGRALFGLTRYREALTAFQKAYKLNSTCDDTLKDLKMTKLAFLKACGFHFENHTSEVDRCVQKLLRLLEFNNDYFLVENSSTLTQAVAINHLAKKDVDSNTNLLDNSCFKTSTPLRENGLNQQTVHELQTRETIPVINSQNKGNVELDGQLISKISMNIKENLIENKNKFPKGEQKEYYLEDSAKNLQSLYQPEEFTVPIKRPCPLHSPISFPTDICGDYEEMPTNLLQCKALFVGNLAKSVTQRQLALIFNDYGKVSNVRLEENEESAFIEYDNTVSPAKAIAILRNKIFDNQTFNPLMPLILRFAPTLQQKQMIELKKEDAKRLIEEGGECFDWRNSSGIGCAYCYFCQFRHIRTNRGIDLPWKLVK